jgi:hypothetical protein
MTFVEKYQSETTWDGKATVMSLYHMAMTHRQSNWTIGKTAEHFGCSIGLVSENLRLAKAIHNDEKILKCVSRQDALKRLVNGKSLGA